MDARQCSAPEAPDWCIYDAELAAWADQVEAAAAAQPVAHAASTAAVRTVARAASATTDVSRTSVPLPPDGYKRTGACTESMADIKRCYDEVATWQTTIRGWLKDRGISGERAAALPPLPIYIDAEDDLARDLTSAAAGAFDLVRDVREDTDNRAAVRISFDAPVGPDYVRSLATDVGATGAASMRGTFYGDGSAITAGFGAPASTSTAAQTEQFYEAQAASVPSLIGGLRADLADDKTDAERAATRRELANVERFGKALEDRKAFVTAVVLRASEARVLKELTEAGSPVQAVASVSPGNTAESAPDPARTVMRAEAAPTAKASAAAVVPRSGGAAKTYMPSRWRAKTRTEEASSHPYVKSTYIGMRWTQPGSLKWYQDDDAHDRGFEVQARPSTKDDKVWSKDWYGDDPEKGICGDPDPRCRYNWNSNLPDSYRDDVAFDGKHKSFAIGSGNGKAIKFAAAYFAWYLTDKGETTQGRVVLEGQRTTRARAWHVEQHGYCRLHGDKDSACFFAEHTANVAVYAVENRWHKYLIHWK